MYNWRKMSPKQQREALENRKLNQRPWHSPPRIRSSCLQRFLFTAACYEHAPLIGISHERFTKFESTLINAVSNFSRVIGWVVLPNHYHLLAAEADATTILQELGRLHGKTSFQWNGEEECRGRKVWCAAAETVMKSDAHFWATLNYIHHNPVKHGLTKRWLDWPWTSAHEYLKTIGRDEAKRIWQQYPISEYGKEWDNF